MFKKFGAFYKIDNNRLPPLRLKSDENAAESVKTEEDSAINTCDAVDYSRYRDYLIRHRRLSAEILRRAKP